MNNGKDKGNLEKWLGIVTVTVSIIALIFSWQANRVASQEATAQIVILDTTWSGSSYSLIENAQKATCVHMFRLTNLGGVSTALTGYKVKISFGKSELSFEDSFESRTRPDKLTPQIGAFEIYLFSVESQIDLAGLLDSKGALELPYLVEPYSTFDIQTAVNFTYVSGLNFESPGRNDPRFPYYDPTVLEGYVPMFLTYTFKSAMGKDITGPPVVCWYIK